LSDIARYQPGTVGPTICPCANFSAPGRSRDHEGDLGLRRSGGVKPLCCLRVAMGSPVRRDAVRCEPRGQPFDSCLREQVSHRVQSCKQPRATEVSCSCLSYGLLAVATMMSRWWTTRRIRRLDRPHATLRPSRVFFLSQRQHLPFMAPVVRPGGLAHGIQLGPQKPSGKPNCWRRHARKIRKGPRHLNT